MNSSQTSFDWSLTLMLVLLVTAIVALMVATV